MTRKKFLATKTSGRLHIGKKLQKSEERESERERERAREKERKSTFSPLNLRYERTGKIFPLAKLLARPRALIPDFFLSSPSELLRIDASTQRSFFLLLTLYQTRARTHAHPSLPSRDEADRPMIWLRRAKSINFPSAELQIEWSGDWIRERDLSVSLLPLPGREKEKSPQGAKT